MQAAAGTQKQIREFHVFLKDLWKDALSTELPDRGIHLKGDIHISLKLFNIEFKETIRLGAIA